MPVYFAQAGEDGLIKIGFAKNTETRLRIMQTTCPENLILRRETAGSRLVETWFHQRFAKLRVAREWFRFHPLMLTLEAPGWLVSGDGDAIYWHTHKHHRTRCAKAGGFRVR